MCLDLQGPQREKSVFTQHGMRLQLALPAVTAYADTGHPSVRLCSHHALFWDTPLPVCHGWTTCLLVVEMEFAYIPQGGVLGQVYDL